MKRILPILMLICLLCSVAACSQQENTVAIITPEPVSAQTDTVTEQTQVEVPDVAPAEQTETNPADEFEQDQRVDSSDYGDSSNSGALSAEEKLAIAQSYIGSSIDALRSAVGNETAVEHVESCLEDGLMEGMFYYDNFVVWTVQYADGSEIVQGVS